MFNYLLERGGLGKCDYIDKIYTNNTKNTKNKTEKKTEIVNEKIEEK
jgi:hypothetical protein